MSAPTTNITQDSSLSNHTYLCQNINKITTNNSCFHILSTAHNHSDNNMDPNAFLDSGTSCHYLKVNASLQDVTHVNDKVSITLPNRESILSTHRGYVPIADLTKAARCAEILPGLEMSSLLSVNQLCDKGCTVVFTKTQATVSKNCNIIFNEKKNSLNNMYQVNIQHQDQPDNTIKVNNMNNLYHLTRSKDVIKYLHWCCFCHQYLHGVMQLTTVSSSLGLTSHQHWFENIFLYHQTLF